MSITYFTATQKQANISRQFLNDHLLTLQPASISLNCVTFLASFNVLCTIHAQLTVICKYKPTRCTKFLD